MFLDVTALDFIIDMFEALLADVVVVVVVLIRFGSPVGTGELAVDASPSSVNGARLNWLWKDMTHWYVQKFRMEASDMVR